MKLTKKDVREALISGANGLYYHSKDLEKEGSNPDLLPEKREALLKAAEKHKKASETLFQMLHPEVELAILNLFPEE